MVVLTLMKLVSQYLLLQDTGFERMFSDKFSTYTKNLISNPISWYFFYSSYAFYPQYTQTAITLVSLKSMKIDKVFLKYVYCLLGFGSLMEFGNNIFCLLVKGLSVRHASMYVSKAVV